MSKVSFNNINKILFSFVFLFGVNSLFAATDLNLAVVDVSQLQEQFLNEVNDKLKIEFKVKQDDLQKKLDKFKLDKDNFDKDSKTMSKAKLEKTADDLQLTQLELQKKVREFDQEVASRRQEELQAKLKILSDVVKNISTNSKYDMILAKNAALYVADKFDITAQVLSDYNKANTTKKT